MKCLQRFSTLVGFVLSVSAWAQAPDISITEPPPLPVVGRLLRPFHFEKRIVSPANLSNTSRLQSLVRAGNLYLSSQDVIALVLENNIDIAVQRYGPYLAREVLRRAEGGGFLRSLGLPVSAGPVSVSLAGVNATAVGLAESGSGVGSGGGIVTQLGTPPPQLDPQVFAFGNFSHTTTPQSNTVLSGTPFFLNDSRTYQFGINQQFATGTSVQALYTSYRSTVNSLYNVLSPYTTGSLDLFVNQPLLRGFSVAVNNRNIRVARNNGKVTDLQFKRQVITTVSAVLNLYWDLVSFNEDMRIKEQAVTAAQKLFDDNTKQVQLGTLASIEVTRAAAELSSSKEELLISQTNVSQQETVLKNALSRNGVESAWLDEVHITALDRIEVPATEDLKPAGELIQQALANRPEVEQTKINVESKRININGTRNALLPTLEAFVDLTNNGLTGELNKVYNGRNGPPDPYLLGGYGNLLGQLARRNFPNYSVGVSLNIPLRNRSAQADYVADQLDLRQSELQLQKSSSQVRVDVKNALIGLQQARARFETANATRSLAQETLTAEQNRFKFGEATIAQVVQAQRDLAVDQSAEVQALANYTHAKIAFDESVGQTLEVNHITLSEAVTGQVARPSSIPPTSIPAASIPKVSVR